MQVLPLAIAVTGLSFAASASALLLRRRALLSAGLLLAGGLVAVAGAVTLATGRDGLSPYPLTLGLSLLVPLALMTFPVPRWRHPVDFVALVAVAGCGVVAMAWPTTAVASLMGLVQGTVFLVHIWWRIEVTRDRERRALQWLALGVGATGLVYAFVAFSAEGARGELVPEAMVVVFALVGPVMYVGATLPDIVDVRGVVVTVTVFTVAVVGFMGVFVVAIALLEALGARPLPIGAVALVGALVAATFHPLQVVLRGVVDELLFGVRPDPLGAASAVADRIGADPLPALRAIREAMVLPYAALVSEGRTLASTGTQTTHTVRVELDGEGELVVGLRPGDLGFSPGDEQVLRLTVPLLAQTLRARAMTAALTESRGQTIAAVEEERRRLRRDLHDGLGPRLSGVAFTSEAARNLLRSHPAEAEKLLVQLRADTVTAIEEIRTLVYAMRPPALDELGLVPALRQQAVGLRGRDGRPLAVRVTASHDLPELPAAVEVAAYRIVTEALTNVARHSTSPTAEVRLKATVEGLAVEVRDAGSGPAWRPGVGLTSMRERATELGGTLQAGPGQAGGCVTALLPL